MHRSAPVIIVGGGPGFVQAGPPVMEPQVTLAMESRRAVSGGATATSAASAGGDALPRRAPPLTEASTDGMREGTPTVLHMQAELVHTSNHTGKRGRGRDTERPRVSNSRARALNSLGRSLGNELETIISDKSQAQLDTITLQIARTEVKSPVAGLITARNAQIGAIASAQAGPMFVITRDGALELRADVSEADLPRIQQGQTATITLAAGTAPLTGKLTLVEPSIDLATRLGRARITLDMPDQVRAGMFAEADILVASRSAIAVPVTAVGSEGKETTVMTVKDGVVHRTVITTGIRDGGWVEVVSGLAEGDQIVAKAGAFVTEGDKINPISAATN